MMSNLTLVDSLWMKWGGNTTMSMYSCIGKVFPTLIFLEES